MRGAIYILCGFVSAGCAARLSGSLQIDGDRFTPTECSTAARYGLEGVELRDAAGKRIRASIGRHSNFSYPSPSVQGVVAVTVLRPGESHEERMYSCGLITVGNQASKVSYRSVEGTADLSCAWEQHTIAGHVDFANCH